MNEPRPLAGASLLTILIALFVAQWVVGAAVFVVAPEPLDETWPPPEWFPAAHVLHVLLAASITTTAIWIQIAIRARLSPRADA